MEVHIPSYYPKFRCLAGACPHTCCGLWEIPVDEATAKAYAAAPGPFGEALRGALTRDEEGELCLKLNGAGRCPLLTEEGLCSVQVRLGEGATPAICREHPRFSYDYGPVRELGLCASCPAVTELVLGEDMALTVEDLPGGEEGDDLLLPLLAARETALSLLKGGEPLSQRLRALLLLGNDLQNAIDEGEDTAFEEICRVYAGGTPMVEVEGLPSREESLDKLLTCLEGLIPLQEEWLTLLAKARRELSEGRTLPRTPEGWGGRMAAYFLYRHWLRALNDGDLLTWCELAVAGTAVAGALALFIEGGCPEVFRRFCLEVEHSQDNLDSLQDALWHTLTLPDLLALAGDAP